LASDPDPAENATQGNNCRKQPLLLLLLQTAEAIMHLYISAFAREITKFQDSDIL